VSSAKRGVRGGLSEFVDEDESEVSDRAGVRFRAVGRFFSSGGLCKCLHQKLGGDGSRAYLG